MRRAALAGVETVEHGDAGDVEVFRLTAERKQPFGQAERGESGRGRASRQAAVLLPPAHDPGAVRAHDALGLPEYFALEAFVKWRE